MAPQTSSSSSWWRRAAGLVVLAALLGAVVVTPPPETSPSSASFSAVTAAAGDDAGVSERSTPATATPTTPTVVAPISDPLVSSGRPSPHWMGQRSVIAWLLPTNGFSEVPIRLARIDQPGAGQVKSLNAATMPVAGEAIDRVQASSPAPTTTSSASFGDPAGMMAAVRIEGSRALFHPAVCLDDALCERIGRRSFDPLGDPRPANASRKAPRAVLAHKAAVEKVANATLRAPLHEARRIPDWALAKLRRFARRALGNWSSSSVANATTEPPWRDGKSLGRRSTSAATWRGRTLPLFPLRALVRSALESKDDSVSAMEEETTAAPHPGAAALGSVAWLAKHFESAALSRSMRRAAGSARTQRFRQELSRDFNIDLALIPQVPVYPDAAALMRATGPTTTTTPASSELNATANATTALPVPGGAAKRVPLLPVDFLAPVPASAVMGGGGSGGEEAWPSRTATTVAGIATVVDDEPLGGGTGTGTGGADAADVEHLTRFAQIKIHRSQMMPTDRRGKAASCDTARIQYTPLSDIGLGGAIRVAASVLGHAMLGGRLLVFKPGWKRWGGGDGDTVCAQLGWECFFLPPSACAAADVDAAVKKFKRPKPAANSPQKGARKPASSSYDPSAIDRRQVDKRVAAPTDPHYASVERHEKLLSSPARIVRSYAVPIGYADVRLIDAPNLLPPSLTRGDFERLTNTSYHSWAMQQLTRYLLRGLQPWAEGLVLQELGRAGYPWAGAGPVVAAHFRNGEGLWHYEVHPQLGCAALDASFQVALLEEAVWALDRAAAAEEEGASETKTPPPGRRECRAVPFLSFDAAWAVNATARWFAETAASTDEDTPQGTAAGDGAHQLCDAGRRAALRAVVVEPTSAEAAGRSNGGGVPKLQQQHPPVKATAAATSSAVAAIGSDTRDAITARHGKGHLMRVSLGNLFLAAGADAWVNNDASNWGLLINSLRGTAAGRWRGAYVDVREAARALGAETVARFCNVVGDVEWDASGWERARRALRAHLQRESQHPSAPP